MKIMQFMTQNNAFADPIPILLGPISKEMNPFWMGVAESSGEKKYLITSTVLLN
jgi:hypothetical protein